MENKIHWGTGWKMMKDEYCDIHPEDHELWLRLWEMASKCKDGDRFSAIIQYFRNAGCKLVGLSTMYAIRPDTMAEDHYEKEKEEYLRPYNDDVIAILKRLWGERK